MSYGIEIRNSDGNVIIEEGFKNFQVVAFGTTNAGSVIPYGNRFDRGGLVFGKPSGVNQNDSFGWHIQGNSVTSSSIFSTYSSVSLDDPVQERPNGFGSTSSTTYDYTQTPITVPYAGKVAPSVDWVYVEPSATSPSAEYGMEVYAADGTVSYSTLVEGEFDLTAVVNITNLNPPAYGQDDYHATAYYGANAGGNNPFDHYMCLTNLFALPITTIPGQWGYLNTGRWTSSGITVMQPTWNIAFYENIGQQYLFGKYTGTGSGGVTGGDPTQNSAPVYVSGISTSYTLNSNGTTITPLFTDPEGGQITLQTSIGGAAELGGGTVELINNGTQIRILPGDGDMSFVLGISASDGTQSTLKTATITYNASPGNTSPTITSGVNSTYSLLGNSAYQTITPFVVDSEGDTYTLIAAASGSSTGMQVTVAGNSVIVSWNGATSQLSFTLNITAVDENGAVGNTVSTVINWEPSVSGPNPNFPNNGTGGIGL